MPSIDAAAFIARMQNGENINLLDVREPIEYSTYNIGGQNIPLSVLPESLKLLNYNKNDEIIVICKVGMRSLTAASILGKSGYKKVINLTGGLMAIQKNRLPKTH